MHLVSQKRLPLPQGSSPTSEEPENERGSPQPGESRSPVSERRGTEVPHHPRESPVFGEPHKDTVLRAQPWRREHGGGSTDPAGLRQGREAPRASRREGARGSEGFGARPRGTGRRRAGRAPAGRDRPLRCAPAPPPRAAPSRSSATPPSPAAAAAPSLPPRPGDALGLPRPGPAPVVPPSRSRPGLDPARPLPPPSGPVTPPVRRGDGARR